MSKQSRRKRRSGKVNDADCKQIRYQELNSSIMTGRRTRWDMRKQLNYAKEKEDKLAKETDGGRTQSCFKSM